MTARCESSHYLHPGTSCTRQPRVVIIRILVTTYKHVLRNQIQFPNPKISSYRNCHRRVKKTYGTNERLKTCFLLNKQYWVKNRYRFRYRYRMKNPDPVVLNVRSGFPYLWIIALPWCQLVGGLNLNPRYLLSAGCA